MKKLNFLSILFVAVMAISTITSCNPTNDDVKPSMTFSDEGAGITGDKTVPVNSPLLFKITAVSNPNTKKNLKTLRIQSWKNNTPNVDTTVTINDDKFLGSFNFHADSNYSVEEKFQFTLTDKAGEAATKTITITTEDAPVNANPINTYSATLLGGQSNPNVGSFYDVNTNTVYQLSGANSNQADIDLIFAYGNTNHYYIASPDDADIAISHSNVASWTTRNSTILMTTSISAADFDAMTDDANFPTVSGSSKVNMLQVGDVFAFQTVDGKKGLVKVTEILGSSGADRAIKIDVKIQQ